MLRFSRRLVLIQHNGLLCAAAGAVAERFATFRYYCLMSVQPLPAFTVTGFQQNFCFCQQVQILTAPLRLPSKLTAHKKHPIP